MTETTTNTKELKIYKKLATIQGKVKEITKTKENAFGKYKYFGEDDAIKEIKPLLEKEGVSLTWGDSPELSHFIYAKESNNHVLRYLKIATLGDGVDTLTFWFWAMGQDPDISKAKGKAETYAFKYFLGKFFMIPMVDGLDPDQEKNPNTTASARTQQTQYQQRQSAYQSGQAQKVIKNPDGSTSLVKEIKK